MSSEDNKKRGYLQGISSYIPEYVKQNFSLSDLSFGSSTAKGAASALFSDKDKEDVNHTCFQSVEYRTSTTVHKRLYLMIAYKTGFQVFDVTDVNRVHEVTSVKEKNCKTIQMLPYPAKQEPGVLQNKHPILAVVTAGDKTETNCMLKFYSLKTQEYVNILQFNSEVFQVACNNSVIAVVAKNQIFLFNIHTLEKMTHLNCFPNNEELNTSSNSLIALGERWIAYPSNQPVNNSKLDFAHFSNQSYTEITMDVAKKAASGIMYLGDLGVKKVVNYINPEKEPQAPVQQKASYSGVPHAGTIEIRDLETKQTVAHFRAHNQPISCLAFDPSGTVLASASQEGTFVHVFQIMPPSSGKVSSTGRGLRHLYKLYRGITSALIQNITFSINSKWIAVSSEHGTTHVFAIEPNGGEIGPDTHCLNTGGLSPRPAVAISKEPFTYSSVSKIKHSSMMPISVSESKSAGSISSFFFSPSRNSTSKQTSVAEKIFVATGRGLLLYYRLDPFESNFEQRTLDLRVKMLGTWDLCRFKHQEAFASPLSIDQYLTTASTSQKRSVEDMTSQWIANVEIETYDPPNIQLWMTGQFKFKTFEKSKLHNSLDQLLRVEDSPVVEEEEEFNNQMTKSVFIRVTDPIPITRIGSSIADDDPSAPPMSESEISRAIETPMGATNSEKPKDWEFLEHSEVVAQVQSIELKSKNNTGRPLSSFITNHNHLGGSKPSNVPQKKVSIAETPVTIPSSTPVVTPKSTASPQQVLPTPQNVISTKSDVRPKEAPQVQKVEPKPLTSPVISPVIQATSPQVLPLKPVEKSKLYPSLESPAEKKKGESAYTEYFRETAPSVQPSTPVQQVKEYQPKSSSISSAAATPVTPASSSPILSSSKKEEISSESMKTSGSKAFFFAMNEDHFSKQKQNQLQNENQETQSQVSAPVPVEVKPARPKEEQTLLHFSNFDVNVQQHEPILSVDTFSAPTTAIKKYPSPPKSNIKINNDFFGQAKSTTFDILSEPYAASTLQRSTFSTTSSAMYNTALRTEENEDEEIQMKLKVLQESEKEDQDNIEDVLSEEEDIVL